jgi:hypothetical protein
MKWPHKLAWEFYIPMGVSQFLISPRRFASRLPDTAIAIGHQLTLSGSKPANALAPKLRNLSSALGCNEDIVRGIGTRGATIVHSVSSEDVC